MTTIVVPANSKDYQDQTLACFTKKARDATWFHSGMRTFPSAPITTNVITIRVPALTSMSVYWTPETHIMLKARICQHDKTNLSIGQTVCYLHYQ
jgi:hypothetical protein